jgi:hypothetical protein
MTINYGQGTAERASQGYILFITATTMVIVAGLFVMGRLTVRYRAQSLGVDDYLITCSLVCLHSGFEVNKLATANSWISFARLFLQFVSMKV